MRLFKRYVYISFAFMAVLILDILPCHAQVTIKLGRNNAYTLSPEDIWNVNMTNQSQTTYEVFLEGSFLDNSGNNLMEVYSRSFSLSPGLKALSAATVEVDHYTFNNPAAQQAVSSTGRFPAGKMLVCISLKVKSSGEELAKDCVEHGNFNFSPPVLISPANEAHIKVLNPLLTWTPPRPVLMEMNPRYELKLVEVQPGQSGTEALINNSAWFEEKNIITNSLTYPASAAALQVGKTYAWQVEAFSGQTSLGQTEVWTFTVDTPEEKKAEKKEDQYSYAVPKRKLTGGYYVATGVLPFMFRNDYTGKDFRSGFTTTADRTLHRAS
jgi:hypothetical protein